MAAKRNVTTPVGDYGSVSGAPSMSSGASVNLRTPTAAIPDSTNKQLFEALQQLGNVAYQAAGIGNQLAKQQEPPGAGRRAAAVGAAAGRAETIAKEIELGFASGTDTDLYDIAAQTKNNHPELPWTQIADLVANKYMAGFAPDAEENPEKHAAFMAYQNNVAQSILSYKVGVIEPEQRQAVINSQVRLLSINAPFFGKMLFGDGASGGRKFDRMLANVRRGDPLMGGLTRDQGAQMITDAAELAAERGDISYAEELIGLLPEDQMELRVTATEELREIRSDHLDKALATKAINPNDDTKWSSMAYEVEQIEKGDPKLQTATASRIAVSVKSGIEMNPELKTAKERRAALADFISKEYRDSEGVMQDVFEVGGPMWDALQEQLAKMPTEADEAAAAAALVRNNEHRVDEVIASVLLNTSSGRPGTAELAGFSVPGKATPITTFDEARSYLREMPGGDANVLKLQDALTKQEISATQSHQASKFAALTKDIYGADSAFALKEQRNALITALSNGEISRDQFTSAIARVNERLPKITLIRHAEFQSMRESIVAGMWDELGGKDELDLALEPSGAERNVTRAYEQQLRAEINAEWNAWAVTEDGTEAGMYDKMKEMREKYFGKVNENGEWIPGRARKLAEEVNALIDAEEKLLQNKPTGKIDAK